MARTRNASLGGVVHDDDGELLDREGKPINPIASHGAIAAQPVEQESPVAPAPEGELTTVHVIDKSSIRRDADAWEVAQMIDLFVRYGSVLPESEFRALRPAEQNQGRWSIRIPDAEFGAVSPDVRRHARRMRVAAE